VLSSTLTFLGAEPEPDEWEGDGEAIGEQHSFETDERDRSYRGFPVGWERS